MAEGSLSTRLVAESASSQSRGWAACESRNTCCAYATRTKPPLSKNALTVGQHRFPRRACASSFGEKWAREG